MWHSFRGGALTGSQDLSVSANDQQIVTQVERQINNSQLA